ncbi:MAG: ATP-binding protein [Gemmataceae bacterium]
MNTPNGLSNGMTYLPTWLSESTEPMALDQMLCGWVKANGWRSAGLAWPCEGTPKLVVMARSEASDRPPHAPIEMADVARSLIGGQSTVIWQIPASAGRLYTLISPPGRKPGVIWADRGPQEPWTELDRSYLRLSAQLIERSSALAEHVGPIVEANRLQHRLADAAVIAGRMAHDFDNILTGIIGFADLTVPLVPAGSQQAKFVAEIAKVGQRGIQFTQQLHQLSRSNQVRPLPASISQAISKEEVRLRPQLPPNVSILTHAPATLPAVAMDMGILQSVVGHVIQNAVEAVPATGPVIVNARAVELNATDAQGYLGNVGPGAHIEVSVLDSGPGIKPEHRLKLFVEPFFTTKVRHRGLGLAVTYRMLCAHRGGIRIDPAVAPATGTGVRIAIPLAAARTPAAVDTAPQFSHSVKG